MTTRIRDIFVLVLGIVIALLGGFQITFDIEPFQTSDLIIGGVMSAVYGWLHFQYTYRNEKTLFDEYYSQKFYKSLEYALGAVVLMIGIIVLVFEQDNMISVSYIYGAMRLGFGLWLLYFSFIVMRENSYE